MKREMIGGLPSKVLGLLIDELEKLRSGKILVSELEKFLKRQDPFKNDEGVIGEWREFYRKHFGIELEQEIKIPERTEDQKKEFTHLLIIAKGLTNNIVSDVCKNNFPCYKYAEDLDKAVPTNERDPKNGTYAIWVRDVVEADEVHKNKSADTIKQENFKTETLLERMLHELVYFFENREHLDIKNVTLCSGSRNSDGNVLGVNWDGCKFGVGWISTEYSNEHLRCREVVC